MEAIVIDGVSLGGGRGMASCGLVGGIGPESTIIYYRSILAEYRRRVPDGSAPGLVIDSIDVQQLLALAGAGELDELTEYLDEALHRLAGADCDFAAIASNTPHIVFDRLKRASPLPLISIVEATADAVHARGLKVVTLFGTRFTMTGSFYPEVFAARGIAIVRPDADALEFIHAAYVGELLNNVLLDATRERMYAIMRTLRRDHHIEAVILGGTELPLLLTEPEHDGLPILDTTQIHVAAIVDRICAGK